MSDPTELSVTLIVLFVAGGVGVLLLFWWLARSTRKQFKCASCGEVVVVEQMNAKRCPVCGSSLGSGREA